MEPTHQTVRLAQGCHRSPRMGACVMELASMLAGESFSDRPETVSPVIAAFLRTYNDGIDDNRRQALYPLAALIVGTRSSRAVERERVSRCLEFARQLGARTPTGRAAIGIATAEASGSWAALSALRDGPSNESHSRALTFVRELVAIQAQAPPGRRPRWLFSRDPARAVEEALSSAPLRTSTNDPSSNAGRDRVAYPSLPAGAGLVQGRGSTLPQPEEGRLLASAATRSAIAGA